MPTAMKDCAPGSSSAGWQERRMRSAVIQAMFAASPRASQASIRASASGNGSALAIPTRSKPRVRARALTASATSARGAAAAVSEGAIRSRRARSVPQAEHGRERLVRDLDAAEALHPLLALGLLFEQLPLERHVAAVALGQHVLAHGA